MELPFTKKQIINIVKKYPTPFYIYDEARITKNSHDLSRAFKEAGFNDFRNFFAVKALPNPQVLKLLLQAGQGLDCSSLSELELAHNLGLSGGNIMFTSNNTTMAEYERAMEMGAIINFDDLSHIQPFLEKFGAPEAACCRYNPGNLRFKNADESIIGKPSEAKYGMTKPQIIEAYVKLKRAGVKTFGLHTMLLSNDLDWRNHIAIAEILLKLAEEISAKIDLSFTFINLGGGIGVPYKPDENSFDLKKFTQGVREAYDKTRLPVLGKPNIVMENGRFITADAGFLITRVVNIKETYKKYIGVDASMANLMRPGMYGAYHQITVLGKEGIELTDIADVTGSLCENNDKFAINRNLPPIDVGDYLVIHTAGAHGHAMGFQYNGKLRSAELLLRSGGNVRCIRRAETLDDYFATLVT